MWSWIVCLPSVAFASASFPMYDPVPTTGVVFNTSDEMLDALFAHGERLEAANAIPFFRHDPPFNVLIEGAQYVGAWLETQPMGGAMYATRNVRLALNNQLVFLRTQRSDGRYSHRINPTPKAPSLPTIPDHATYLQGLYMASPAVDVAWFMNLTEGNQVIQYLRELSSSIEAFDRFMWTTRNDSTCCGMRTGIPQPHCCPCKPSTGPGNLRGLLWEGGNYGGKCVGYQCSGSCADTGEDGCNKFVNNSQPIQSMDMMGYSYDCRRALARIARLLGDGAREQRWLAAAEEVAKKTKANLWRPEFGAMYYRDFEDGWVTTLTHNNIRMMWHGLFDQEMADVFVQHHLMNASEFWTNMPLPTSAISDARFNDRPGNSWDGQPQGLTLQRAIRALENYGHVAELTLIGKRLTAALLKGCVGDKSKCHFPQQIDPFTAIPQAGDGYGPMILSLLEYTALRSGVVPRPDHGLFWSGIGDDSSTRVTFTQTLGSNNYTLHMLNGGFTGEINGRARFNCTGGVRVLTDLRGTVTGIWGIDSVIHTTTLHGFFPDCEGQACVSSFILQVKPNEQWSVTHTSGGPKATLSRATPYMPPFGGVEAQRILV